MEETHTLIAVVLFNPASIKRTNRVAPLSSEPSEAGCIERRKAQRGVKMVVTY
jgi:hypothetical protein